MLYVIEGHSLLQGDAIGLTGGDLEDQVAIAERVLGFRGAGAIIFTGDDELDAARAIALQVSLQVAEDPESFLLETVGRGSESMAYVDMGQGRKQVRIHPTAWEIKTQLFDEAANPGGTTKKEEWPVTKSLRR